MGRNYEGCKRGKVVNAKLVGHAASRLYAHREAMDERAIMWAWEEGGEEQSACICSVIEN